MGCSLPTDNAEGKVDFSIRAENYYDMWPL
jgi:hypothetical protein